MVVEKVHQFWNLFQKFLAVQLCGGGEQLTDSFHVPVFGQLYQRFQRVGFCDGSLWYFLYRVHDVNAGRLFRCIFAGQFFWIDCYIGKTN